jgi:hypothetical protein
VGLGKWILAKFNLDLLCVLSLSNSQVDLAKPKVEPTDTTHISHVEKNPKKKGTLKRF